MPVLLVLSLGPFASGGIPARLRTVAGQWRAWAVYGVLGASYAAAYTRWVPSPRRGGRPTDWSGLVRAMVGESLGSVSLGGPGAGPRRTRRCCRSTCRSGRGPQLGRDRRGAGGRARGPAPPRRADRPGERSPAGGRVGRWRARPGRLGRAPSSGPSWATSCATSPTPPWSSPSPSPCGASRSPGRTRRQRRPAGAALAPLAARRAPGPASPRPAARRGRRGARAARGRRVVLEHLRRRVARPYATRAFVERAAQAADERPRTVADVPVRRR